MIEWVLLTLGYTPYFILGSNIFFPSCYSSFYITYLSKCFNHSENTSEMISICFDVAKSLHVSYNIIHAHSCT